VNLILAAFFQFSVATVPPRAADSIAYLQTQVQPVIEYATEWGGTAALSLVSTQAFLAVCKRFLE
jgi:hypothetical protein